MIIYGAVPYLLAAAPPVIVLLSILLSDCTMASPGSEAAYRVRFYSEADSRAGDELVRGTRSARSA